MPRSADALPITMILPAPRAAMAGSTARTSRGSGSTSAAKVSRHSVSDTSAASVEGAVTARFTTSTSMWPAAATMRAGASASSNGSVFDATTAPCAASTSHSVGPMKASAWVTSTRLPKSMRAVGGALPLT